MTRNKWAFPTPHPQRWIRHFRWESPEPFGSPEVDEAIVMSDGEWGDPAGPEITMALVLDGAISENGSVLYELRLQQVVRAWDMVSGVEIDPSTLEPENMVAISSSCDLSGTRMFTRAIQQREAMGPVWDRALMVAGGVGDEVLRVRITDAWTARPGGGRRIVGLEVVVLEVLRTAEGLMVGNVLDVHCPEQQNPHYHPDRYRRGFKFDAVLIRARPGSAAFEAMEVQDELARKYQGSDRVGEPDVDGSKLPGFFVGAEGESSLGNFERPNRSDWEEAIAGKALREHEAWFRGGRKGPGRIDVSNIACVGQQVHGRFWRGARFRRCNFSRSNLKLSWFDYGEVSACTFVEADMEGVTFENALVTDCNFDRSRPASTSFKNCELRGGTFRDAIPAHTLWKDCNAQDVDFQRANFKAAVIEGGRFLNCDFRGADLKDTYLDGAVFERCDMRGINLQGARVGGAAFRGCALYGTRGKPILAPSSRFVDTDMSAQRDGRIQSTEKDVKRQLGG